MNSNRCLIGIVTLNYPVLNVSFPLKSILPLICFIVEPDNCILPAARSVRPWCHCRDSFSHHTPNSSYQQIVLPQASENIQDIVLGTAHHSSGHHPELICHHLARTGASLFSCLSPTIAQLQSVLLWGSISHLLGSYVRSYPPSA